MADLEIDVSGPLFDGRAEAAVQDFLRDAAEEVARVGEGDVQSVLRVVLRHPTGRYQGSIVIERQGNDRVIHGDRVIYGAWLEGVGSRNRTTRFKGYATFRLVTQALRDKVGWIVLPVLISHLRRMQ